MKYKNNKFGFLNQNLFLVSFFFSVILGSFLFFGVGKGWASTDVHYVTMDGAGNRNGSSLNNAFGWAEIMRSENWDADEDDDGKVGAGDMVYLYDDGGPFYGFVPIRQSGLSGKPITFTVPDGESSEIWGGIDGSLLNIGVPTEMITNSDFETGDKSGWTAADSGSSLFTVETDDKHNGTYAIKAVRNGSTIRLRQTISVTPNTWYGFTFWHKRTSGSSYATLSLDDNMTIDGANSRYLQDNLTTWAATAESVDGNNTDQSSWIKRGFVFRTSENQSEVEIVLSFFGDVTNYLDDFSMKRIQWEQVNENEYKLTPLFLDLDNSYWNNQVPPTVAWYNGSPLTLGTSGSLNSGEQAYDSTSYEFHVNVGENPEGLDIKIPLFASLIGDSTGKDYITINGISFKYVGNAGNTVDERAAIVAKDSKSDNWIIIDNTFSNVVNGVRNASDSSGDNWEITNNTFSNCWNGREYGGTSPAGSCVNTYGDNQTISKNHFYNGYTPIVHFGCGSNISYNVLNGIRVNGIWQDGNCRPSEVSTSIYNNSLYHNSPTGIAGHGIVLQDNVEPYGDTASGAKIRNNIVHTHQVDSGASQALCIFKSPYIEEDNNLFYATGGASYISKLAYTGVLDSSFYSIIDDFKAAMSSLKDNTTTYWTNNLGVVGEAASANDLSANPLWVDFSGGDYSLQSTSPAIDAGTDVSLATDFEGNPIYGAPDIGAYEFQPPYEAGTDEIDIGSGARIYGDGKFRNVNSTSGTTASLLVDPEGDDTSKYLDVEISLWTTSGTCHKTWAESSDTLGTTNTLHTVGDLIAGNSYNVKIDGVQTTDSNLTGTDCANGVCVADATGKITFTYTGGYSEHSFDVEDANPDAEGEATEDEDEEEEETSLNVNKVKATSTQDSITIEWKTDHKTKSTVSYGTDKNLKEKKKDNDKEKKHEINLTDLLPDTRYYFRIKAKDGDDNEDKSRIHTIRTKSNANTSKAVSQTTNNSSYSSSPSPASSSNSTPNICSYTIAEGDTLWSIAKKVYGDATAYPQIIEKNQDKYPDIAFKLNIGQELTFGCEEVKGINDENDSSSSNDNGNDNQTQNQEPEYARWWNPFSWF